MKYLDYIDPIAEKIGAVNTVVNESGRLSGYNTDYYGLKSLIERNVDIAAKKVVILGTGGTSNTAKFVSEGLGCKECLTVSREVGRGDITYEELYEEHTDTEVIVNATPLGMYPDTDSAAVDVTKFKELVCVIDAIYNPLNTKLVYTARKNGIKAEGGLYMLVCQAALSAELFTGKRLGKQKVQTVYENLYKQKQNIVLIGMPGCGKSLCAKATAATFNSPLLKMDMGSMMGKYVGESEANLRKAIRIAEAAAPCVLWIDEIEKAFSGVGGNNDIMTRMFGYFLSWMQEKKSAVYVFATANNADRLPPELKRKGRFDEIFCVNLPNKKEREEIFKVHIKKKGRNSGNLVLGKLAEVTEGFNGADIESVVNEAIEYCFLENKNLETKILEEIAKHTKSISKSCKSQIEDMEVLFDENDFTNASEDPYWILSKAEMDKRKNGRQQKN